MRKNHMHNDVHTRERVTEPNRLLLDEILNSNDPVVATYFTQTFQDEMAIAQERALLRVGLKFKHLLPPQQQKMLDRTVASFGDSTLSALAV